MKLIFLGGKNGSVIGNYAMVDDGDYDWLNKHNWTCYFQKRKNNYYAHRGVYNKETKKITLVSMHRLILGLLDPKILGDHEDSNGLNNQRSNLRIANYSQNGANRKSKKNANSKYLGVTVHGNGFLACVRKNKKKHNKYFQTEKEAAMGYNEMAKKLHGDFASLNIIE